jgi:hypothetical protein
VLKSEFTNVADSLTIDIRSAYDLESLKKLERTFVYSRTEGGSLRVADVAEFSEPTSLGTALITFSPWRKSGPRQLVIGQGHQALRVDIDTGGRAWELTEEVLEEDLPGGRHPVRLGIELLEPSLDARIDVLIAPLERQ